MRNILFIILLFGWGCSESGFTSASAERTAGKDKNNRDISDSDTDLDANGKKNGKGGEDSEDGEDGDDESGKSGKNGKKGKNGKNGDDSDSDLGVADGDEDISVDSTKASSKPEGFVEIENGEKVIRADYTACASLPSAGKRGYGKCEANAVVVIVNDGKAQEMTCCPLGGKNVLSAKDSDLHIQRSGTCQANEVLTGMADPHTPSGYCSKINDKYLKLSAPIPSKYVTGNVPGIMGQIAKSYNVSDTCICPEGTIAIGGHTPQDNR
jgi:hypothetical protein